MAAEIIGYRENGSPIYSISGSDLGFPDLTQALPLDVLAGSAASAISNLGDPFAGYSVGGAPSFFNLGSATGTGPGGFDPTLNVDPSGGGGGFSLANFKDAFGIGADLLKAGGGIYSQIQNAKYQSALQDYYKQQQAYANQYNQAYLDYLKQQQAYEANLLGQFGDQEQAFQDALTTFQGQISDVFNTELSAAQPLLQSGQQLSDKGVEALTKGEVPAEWKSVFDQARERTRAAALQRAANAGIDPQTADAQIEAQLNQDQQTMLIQMAQGVITSGLQESQTGGQLASAAGAAASAGISPFISEFEATQRLLAALLGSAPGPVGSFGGPPAPVA